MKQRNRRPRDDFGINTGTEEIGTGPVTLNVRMARAHGWSERDIINAYAKLEHVARYYGARAVKRYPDRYEYEGGTRVFRGPYTT